ncbi:MAG TPA: thiazole tautomerase TenI [Candidatus Avamphibacillus sp.]|nr:thiazole tautomerase TenI [Candidatus Avamphibacillus sp.]
MKQLHIISTGEQTINEFIEKVTDIHSFVDFIHLRESNWTAREYITVIDQLCKRGIPREKIIVNDRVDVAKVTDVGGVQLTLHSIDVQDVNRIFPELYIGCSVHSVKEAIASEKGGANFLIYGHIFETASKPGLPPRGLHMLKDVVKSVTIPVIAIGGITPDNAKRVIRTNVSGIAVMSGVLLADDVKNTVRQYQKKLIESKGVK